MSIFLEGSHNFLESYIWFLMGLKSGFNGFVNITNKRKHNLGIMFRSEKWVPEIPGGVQMRPSRRQSVSPGQIVQEKPQGPGICRTRTTKIRFGRLTSIGRYQDLNRVPFATKQMLNPLVDVRAL